jgi:hypothetical protein
MLTAGAIGLLGGICANLKIHGGLYILPALVYHLCRSPGTAAGRRLTCVTGCTAAIALAVPFIPDTVSLSEYYHYFQVLSHHPWNRWLFEQNVVFEVMCLLPILAMYGLFVTRPPPAFSVRRNSSLVYDVGYISRVGERSRTTPPAAFSSVCRFGLCCHAPRGRVSLQDLRQGAGTKVSLGA